MRRALPLLFSLLPAVAFAQVSPPTRVDVQDEGSSQGRVRALNCVGSGIACTVSGSTGTLTVSGGSGSNSVEKSIALTSLQPNPAVATVTGATWVGASSIIVCGVLGTTADGLTPETINAAKLGISVENRVAGTGFDIRVENFYGLEGTIRIHCIGV